MTKLVIVESPTKARTIRNYLPKEYHVEASMGHVRDLPASAGEIPEKHKGEAWARLGVNVQQDFDPLYVVPASKRKTVANLRELLKKADTLILATDEDREGESIGWHLSELLKPKVPVQRMVFHEITREAILEALQNTRAIDQNLVRAQESRRILDRLVGYTVSPLLWKKIAPRLSAGRVQSVAVRLLVRRERERRAFRSGTFWDLTAHLNKRPDQPAHRFAAQLVSVGGVRVASGRDFDEATGQIATTKKGSKDVLLLDVTPLSLGVETMGGMMTPLIERNTTVPVQKSEVFSTAADSQTAVDIHVLQGERPMAVDNMTLGHFRLEGIAPAPRGVPQIEVMFDIDANGILNVTATDKATGKAQKITVTASTNLSEDEVKRMVREAEQHRTEDEHRRELVSARNEADTLVYQAEKALRDLGDNVPANDRQTIEAQIESVKQTVSGEDVSAIRSALQTLQNATYALTQQINAADSSAADGGSYQGPSNGRSEPEDVVEGDFSEV